MREVFLGYLKAKTRNYSKTLNMNEEDFILDELVFRGARFSDMNENEFMIVFLELALPYATQPADLSTVRACKN